MAFRLGFVLGAIIALLVGAWFVWTTATAEGVGATDLRLLGGLAALCLVIAVVLALAAEVSPFFPGLGLGFCLPAALSSLVCAVISGFHGWADVALGYVLMMLALVACSLIITAITPRRHARG